MRLSHESPGLRWTALVATWIVLGTLAAFHTRTVADYLDLADALGLRGAQAPGTPLQTVYPAFAADAQTWVRHALALLEGDSLRLRFTTIDNAPFGREVHWNSAWAWAIAGAGWMQHWILGQPLNLAVERAALWLPPATMMVLVIVFSAWMARVGGALAGVMVALALVGNARLSEGFFPKYVDHHGLLSYAALGVVLGMSVAAAGWRRRRTDGGPKEIPESLELMRSGAVFSAICGASGLWVSAASVIPPIAVTGAAGLLVAVLAGKPAREAGLEFQPEIWRLWGRVGGGLSFAFYLLEYFPSHMGFRLEPNHPVHALAWLGGGELIALLGERFSGRPAESPWPWRRLAWAGAAVACAPIAILAGGPGAFVVLDLFMSRLHNEYIQEFLPMWRTLFGSGWRGLYTVFVLDLFPLLAGFALAAFWRRKVPVTVWFSIAVSGALFLLACLQSRWLLNASGALVCTAVVLAGLACARGGRWARWLLVPAFCGWIYVYPAVQRFVLSREDVGARRVSPRDAHQALARDIAAAIRSSQPKGDIVLLSSPNSSTSIGYYGRFKTLGTLYWENSQGLKNAADVYSAPGEAAAAELIKRFGITHLALLTEENFIAQYYLLKNPGVPQEDVRKGFGHQIFVERRLPAWLRVIPYKVPDDLAVLKQTVMLLAVDFTQSPADAIYHIAMGKVVDGAVAEAEKDFAYLAENVPASPQPWLRLSELAFLRQDGPSALRYAIEGTKRLPPAERAAGVADAAAKFYRAGSPQGAVILYRHGLSFGFNPDLASSLAFILATNKDDALRNAREALSLATEAVAAAPRSVVALSALAAAQAEAGNFAEAIAATERALATARLDGSEPGVRISTERLERFRAGKPLRE